MKTSLILKIFLSLLFLSYPFVVYFGFQHLSMGTTTGLILLLFAIRLLVIGKSKSSLEKTVFIATIVMAIICLLGALLKEYKLIMLYPILMSLGLASLFAFSLKEGQTPIVEILARLKDKELPLKAISYTRVVTKVWLGFFIINASISFYTYQFTNFETWTLYNGLISYFLMGLLMGVEYIVRLKLKKKWKVASDV